MGEQQYNIIFRGDIVFGCQLAEVKLRLQQLFKTDEAKINALFTGKPVALKRNLDFSSAEKYRSVLINAGAQVEIVAVEIVAADTAKVTGVEPSAPMPLSAQSIAAVAAPMPPLVPLSPDVKPALTAKHPAEDWSLAPVGDNLLKAAEQAPVVVRTFATDSLSLRPVGGNILEAHEQPPSVPAAVVVPGFEVASVGSDLLRADEKLPESAAAIALQQWDLAAVGADLIKEDEREIVIPALIAIPDVGLAPVGADLGQIKPQIKPLVPDISGIHLLD